MSILDKIKTMKKAGPLFLDLHLIKPSQCSSIGVVYSVETVLDATTGLPPRFQPGCCHHFITGDIAPLIVVPHGRRDN